MRAGILRGDSRRSNRAGSRRSETWVVLRGASSTVRGRVGLLLILLVGGLAFVGPLLSSYSPTELLGVPFSGPGNGQLLGTDVLGRDVTARLLHGGSRMIVIAALATALGLTIGCLSGITAAYIRRVDGVIGFASNTILAFPELVLALLLVSIVGTAPWLIVVAIGIAHAPQVARVVRGATLDIAERDYVRASELQGYSRSQIMLGDIAPNLLSPIIVEIGIRFTYSLLTVAGLAFLGFGEPPPAPMWASMINENRIGLQANPWATLAPLILIAALTVGVNTFGDAVSSAVARGRTDDTGSPADPATESVDKLQGPEDGL